MGSMEYKFRFFGDIYIRNKRISNIYVGLFSWLLTISIWVYPSELLHYIDGVGFGPPIVLNWMGAICKLQMGQR